MKSMNRESMVFYRSYMEAAKTAELSPEKRCEFYEGIVMYATTNEVPVFSCRILQGLFVICKANIDANTRKYDEHLKAVENGKKGGAPKGNRNAAKDKGKKKEKTGNKKESEKESEKGQEAQEKPQNEPENKQKTTPETTINVTVTDNVTDNANVTDNVNKTLKSSFSFKTSNTKEKKKKKYFELSLAERCERLRQSILPYVEAFGVEPMQDFFDYWRETNRENTMMRFEMERSWKLSRRIESWMEKREKLERNFPGRFCA